MKNKTRNGAGLAGLALLVLGAYSLSTAAPAPAPALVGPNVITQLPWVIYESGYYVIDENLTGSQGISVEASDVVIDLCGFTIKSDGSSSARGVYFIGSFTNVTVKNGTVLAWDGGGVQLPANSKAQDLHIRSCGNGGLRVGNRSIVERCNMDLNAERSLSTGEDSIVKCCRVNSNGTERLVAFLDHGTVAHDLHVIGGETAIFCGQGVQLNRCKAEARGSRGIATGSHALLQNCSVSPAEGESAAAGIQVGAFSRVETCAVWDVGGVGIQAGAHGTVADSSVSGVGETGILVDEASEVTACMVNACNETGAVGGAGIRGGHEVVVRGARASHNQGPGIHLEGSGGRVEGCSAYGNSQHGILLTDGAVAERNSSHHNLLAGIHVTGSDQVLWRNYAHENQDGVSIIGVRNVVTENHATKNTGQDFIVPWGNPRGPFDESMAQVPAGKPRSNYETPLGY